MSKFKKNRCIPFQCCFPLPEIGPTGITGATGATGPSGSTGATGATGVVLDFADFYALMPPDNAATVAIGGDVDFPRDGPSSRGDCPYWCRYI